jgi:cyclic beta-1,2-glucan synthetase
MAEPSKIEIVRPELTLVPAVAEKDPLWLKGAELARNLPWQADTRASDAFAARVEKAREALRPVFAVLDAPEPKGPLSEDMRWLRDRARLMRGDLAGAGSAAGALRQVPHVRDLNNEIVPRVLGLAEGFFQATECRFEEELLTTFLNGFQQVVVLDLRELWALVPALKLALLEQIATRSEGIRKGDAAAVSEACLCVRSLEAVSHVHWKAVLEPLIVFEKVLEQDPAGTYPRMDFDSRDLYRSKVSSMALHADASEIEVARAALKLAQEARQRRYADPRVSLREGHVGFYLIDQGRRQLEQAVGYHAPMDVRLQIWVHEHADEFFFPGLEILTFLILIGTALVLTPRTLSPIPLALTVLVLLLPCSQAAVQLMNQLVTTILPASRLPKMDYSDGIPQDCVTLVAVPTLLLSEQQVRRLVEDLEVRFLGNHDPNMHFALLSDLPDSREPAREDSPLIDLCSKLITELNEKYASRKLGAFFLLHRHRVYNPQERSWMGWERKRGKLMDLNRLLRGRFDSFPVKVGDLSLLSRVRFVITLDSDTELPRGSAQRMVGALAHPLNQAVIDPEKNIVTAGYGILQPRVGISVQSTSSSRLAAIYAGETGLDPYTHAISDAYQDLFGEGIFTGKGIYEVGTLFRVLDRRFPKNALLSHDLIEGSHARAGLVSDIEVIEDYPSHYSAYNRRKHRWLRGDWQITQWLFKTVPDESGASVPNPISLVSRWKILDNLRRSLVEPATFLLLLTGWLFGNSPALWTLATITLLFLPMLGEFFMNCAHAIVSRNFGGIRGAMRLLFAAFTSVFLQITFLGHQALVSLDAMTRAFIRRFITRKGLLEWETAAQAELGAARRTPVDTYLNWMPVVALAVGALVALVRPRALWSAAPIILLWGCSKLVAMWLNGPARPVRNAMSRKQTQFLRKSALSTWRYFAEYSTPEHNWLIPDNVQEDPLVVAARVSPTNVGLLLNARQVACEFGYLTVPDFVQQTLLTLSTIEKLRKHEGHLLNWYNTHTLEPLHPYFVSSVDNGNLLASLWTLQQGCLERLRQPVVQPSLLQGLLDHLDMLVEMGVFPAKEIAPRERESKSGDWLHAALSVPESLLEDSLVDESKKKKYRNLENAKRLLAATREHQENLERAARSYAPWTLPEFAGLRDDPALNLRLMENLALEQLPAFIERLEKNLNICAENGNQERGTLCERLRETLPVARENVVSLIEDLRRAAAQAGEMAEAMNFSILIDPRRRVLSIGLDTETGKLHPACYDLLASEARTAMFVAIAKDDVPQESWFQVGRAHTFDQGRPVLLSWTGTMFEYLMPTIWMRSYPNTLLERSQSAAVRSQQAHGEALRVPWGISESGYAKRDDAGNYHYHAFGLPQLALHKPEIPRLVISPYSTMLAVPIDPVGSLENLLRMEELGWFGRCGFYEAGDYTDGKRRFRRPTFELVRSWMAHHQGMSLLALANYLQDGVVQRWFHNDRRVQATELLLHEKPVATAPKPAAPSKTSVG